MSFYNPVDFRILACCGVKELSGLASQRSMPAVLRQVEATFVNPATRPTSCAFILFTEVTNHGAVYGQKLKEYIETNHLGTVTETKKALNPNSHNTIRAFLWALDHEAITAHVHAHPARYKVRKNILVPSTSVAPPHQGVPGGSINFGRG